jgi:hypothetical protein
VTGSEGGKKWLVWGCQGCLALVVLVLLVVAVVVGTAWVEVKNEQPTERTLTPELPAPPRAEGRPLRVAMRLGSAEFRLLPARPGEPLAVDAHYDEKTYELREQLETTEAGDRYEIDFARKTGWLTAMLRGLLGGSSPRVEIRLPLDVPLDLELELHQGGAEMELGGLWLNSAAIELSQGGLELGIGEPLREPMQSLEIHGSMGGMAVSRLGNASPRRLDVDLRMGGMELDLRGAWRADADVTIRTRQAGGDVTLPQDVHIVGVETKRLAPVEEPETPRPTLTFSISAEQGELEIHE